MGSFANYAEDKILDHIVGKTSFTMPTTVAVALCTADPTDAGTGASCNEVPDTNAYARKDTSGTDWAVSSGGATSNAGDLTFPEATGSWGTVTHFALIDNASHGSGNMLAHSVLGASKVIGSGDTPKFATGDLDLTLD